ncbi:MAG: hypothetical protein AB1916_12305 [Thermodesulfobacteriota bacterium]
MEEKSVADAIRELEDDFAAGRIGSKEFVRAMKELLARRTPGAARHAETWAEPPRAAAPPAEAAPEGSPPEEPAPPPAAPARPKAAAQTPDPAPFNQSDLPPIRIERAAKAEEARPRVIVKGAAPWEKEEDQVRFESVEARERRRAAGGVIHDGQGILRERLATMADEEVKGLLREKDPNLAALLSLLLGGGGQFYLGLHWLGAAFLAVWLLALLGLFYDETWVLYVLAPAQVLAAALAQREAQARNRSIEQKRTAGERLRRRGESSFDPDKAVRNTEKHG